MRKMASATRAPSSGAPTNVLTPYFNNRRTTITVGNSVCILDMKNRNKEAKLQCTDFQHTQPKMVPVKSITHFPSMNKEKQEGAFSITMRGRKCICKVDKMPLKSDAGVLFYHNFRK